jgi:outer membrane protein assembly factor BamE (lipoprotein component of BamABCDE complex)
MTGQRGGQGGWARRVLGLCAILAVMACTPQIRNHGYVPTEEDLAAIKVGVDTRETVASAVGRPSAQALLSDTGWYYVRSTYRTIGPREPQEIDRQVVAISFTDAGVLENIERFGLEDGRVVVLSRRVTDTNIKGIGLLRQIFSNFGRFNAGDFLQ